MARHRSHSIAFKRQVAQEFVAGETLHGLAKRHDLSRNLIRLWVQKHEAGAFDEDATAADSIQEYEARIVVLARLVGISRSIDARLTIAALKVATNVEGRRPVVCITPPADRNTLRRPTVTSSPTMVW